MQLPKPLEVTEKETSYPSRIILYAKPKQGKSTVLSELSKQSRCLIIDTEKSHKMLDSVKVELTETATNIERWKELLDIRDAIKAEIKATGKAPYDIIVIDTLTRVDELAEWAGTINYMKKPQGKTFNRKLDARNVPTKEIVDIDSTEWESVHELGQGFGYRYSREAIMNLVQDFETLAPVVIYVCHVKDKLVGVSSGDEVVTKEIALTGKVKDILASKVDTIACAVRDGDKLNVSFSNEDGSRCSHLSGKTITLSEKTKDGKIVTYWDRIIDPKYLIKN